MPTQEGTPMTEDATPKVDCGHCSTEYPATETICPGCGLGDGQ